HRQAARLALRAPPLAALGEDEVRGRAGARRRRLHRPPGRSRGPGSAARGLLRRRGLRLRGEARHRVRYEAAPGPPRPVGWARDRGLALHAGDRPAAAARALGAPRDRGPGRVRRVDGARQAAPSASDGGPLRQDRPGRRAGDVMAVAPAGVITHPDKVLFPEDGITKRELADYYERVAPLMVPHMRARPVTMERYPAGIGVKGFMHKDVSKGFPQWLQRVEAPKKDGTVHYPLVTDTRSLLWLANQNCITPHVWASRAPRLFQPDICVFDLDPAEEAPDVL